MRHWFLATLTAAAMSTAGYAQPHHETVTEGLEYPWSLAFLPDGRMLVTEKPGRFRVIDEAGLRADAVSCLPDFLYSGQAGLLRVVLPPYFGPNQSIFLPSFS